MEIKDLKMNKRYMIFNSPQYYPSGGMGDLVFATDDKDEAEKVFKFLKDDLDYDLVDMHDYTEKYYCKFDTVKIKKFLGES